MVRHIGGLCPYCHKDVTFSWVDLDNHGGNLSNFFFHFFKNLKGIWVIAECPFCKNCVLVFSEKIQDDILWGIKITPFPLPSPVDNELPENIKKALTEAKLCLSVGAPMACVTMCRRAIQCACLEKGATKKDLYDQIDELSDKGIITSQIKEWAHSVRWVGNDGAHPNNLEVEKEDAEDMLDLTEQFMRILYTLPAIAKKHSDLHKKE